MTNVILRSHSDNTRGVKAISTEGQQKRFCCRFAFGRHKTTPATDENDGPSISFLTRGLILATVLSVARFQDEPMDTDQSSTFLSSIQSEIAKYHLLIEEENQKLKRYKVGGDSAVLSECH